MGRRTIAPTLTAYVKAGMDEARRKYGRDHVNPLIEAELRYLKAVARLVEHEHDPRFREIANEDHSNCQICRALARLRRASSSQHDRVLARITTEAMREPGRKENARRVGSALRRASRKGGRS